MYVKKFTGLNWDDLRNFACFAASGSLSAAARELNVEPATISRRIDSLEADLNLKRVDRRGRKLRLTPAGVEIAAIIKEMGIEAQRFLRHAHSATRGAMSRSVPHLRSRPPCWHRLSRRGMRGGANLRVFISSDIHAASLDHREADIVIRLRRPDRGDLTAVRLGRIPFRLYALPDYLKQTAEADWEYVTLGGALATSPQQIARAGKATAPGLSTDHVEMQLALVRGGAGVAMRPDFLAAGDPGLTRLQTPPLTRDVWLTYHSDMKTAASMQAVIQELESLKF